MNQLLLHVEIRRRGAPILYSVLKPGTYAVGSAAECDLRVSDPTAPELVAVLMFKDGQTRFKALTDAHDAPLLLNGRPVKNIERLGSVDQLYFGDFVLRAGFHAPSSVDLEPVSVVVEREALLAKPVEEERPPVQVTPSLLAEQALFADLEPNLEPTRAEPRVARRPQVRIDTPSRGVLKRSPSRDGFTRPDIERTQLIGPSRLGVPLRRSTPVNPKGPHRLHLSLWWGDLMRASSSFAAEKNKSRVVWGDCEEGADFPLYGFSVPEKGMPIAEASGHGYRVWIPPNATVEVRKGDEFVPLAESLIQKSKHGPFVVMQPGRELMIREGQMALVAELQNPPEKVKIPLFREVPWLAAASLAFFAGALALFVAQLPEREELETRPGGPPAVAVRLAIIEPKKKEEAKKKVEELKAKEKKKEEAPKTKVAEEKRPKERTPQTTSKALKSLAKLTTAGPAAKTLFGQLDNMPTFKDAKPAIGGLMLASTAGLGGPALGGTALVRGQGGMGAAMLRSGSGIGALGARGIGKGGRIGGTVQRAQARSVEVKGTIDREAVARVVNGHLQEVRGCYESALLKSPGLAGKVVLEWTIDTAGKVLQARTKSSTLQSSAVESCILRYIRSWRFPLAKGGVVVVSYPFLFNSVGY